MKIRWFFLLLTSSILIQAPQGVFASDGGHFEVSVVSYKNASKYLIIKYNNVTGETWIRNKDGFTLVPEDKQVPESTYKVESIPILQGFFATRIDTQSGKTWLIKDSKWVAYE